MKVLVLVLCAFASISSFAADTLVKECNVTFRTPEKSQDMLFKILSNNGQLRAQISMMADGKLWSQEETVTVVEGSIRADLSQLDFESDAVETLSEAESLIGHAISVSQDPELKDYFSSGIDLSKVRSIKGFLVGQRTSMGSTTIIEAMDSEGKTLGSFVGGFLVAPCK